MEDGMTDDTDRGAYEAGREVRGQRWLLFLVGGVSILAGALAIFLPFIATVTAAFVAGAALVISGVFGLFAAFRRSEGWEMASAFALSLLALAAGVLIFLEPVAGIFALTTLVIAWFGAIGLLRIWYGARALGEGGGWMIAMGVLAVAVALLLWFGLPFSATWVLGVLLGIDLLLWGSLLLAFALRLGRRPEV
ncbi:HdeD family acid-resistance protein [Roseicyclus sp.]|uniref:HdeD family acid-resistance protein n=1 Tax=Roseicyclus sp. TaxID=1914329 RepID=UPI003FA02863